MHSSLFRIFLFLLMGILSAHAQSDRAIRRIDTDPTEQRVALLIGNANYAAVPSLRNPVRDVQAMSAALRAVDFEVIQTVDANRLDMLQAIRQFGDRIRAGGVGLFYYSGHGLQVNGKNYLIPVDAQMAAEDEVQDYCIDASSVLRKMESAGNRLNIAVLDACRNNPFKGSRFRSVGAGLARMDAPTGSLIAYSTGPGMVADDGDGANGLYTSALLRFMRTPGLKLEDVFKQVRVAVLEESNQRQVPWESSSLTGDFYFLPGASDGGEAQVVPPPPLVEDVVLGHLQVISNAPNSQVYVNGTYKGVVGPGQPLNLSNLPVGTVRVVVKANGYQDGGGTYALRANDWVQARVSLVAVAPPPPPVVVEEVDTGGSGGACGSDMVWVPAGEFSMGSENGDGDERPVHRVYLDGYCIDKYEVTVDAYARCVRAGACKEPLASNEKYTWGKSGQGTHPINGVSWHDAVAYCGWAGKRLPSEAEWEKAARGTDGRVYPWGNAFGEGRANLSGSSDGYGYTSPVGNYSGGVSRYGAYDMAGNVWEWVADWYSSSYYASSPSRNPPGPSSGDYRVVRGGSWFFTSDYLRAADRDSGHPDDGHYFVGFRCARQ